MLSHGAAVAQSWQMESAPYTIVVTVTYSSSRNMNQEEMGKQEGREEGSPTSHGTAHERTGVGAGEVDRTGCWVLFLHSIRNKRCVTLRKLVPLSGIL